MKNKNWADSDIGLAIRLLGKHERMDTATLEIGYALGRKVDKDILTKAFKRKGLGKPSEYLNYRVIEKEIRESTDEQLALLEELLAMADEDVQALRGGDGLPVEEPSRDDLGCKIWIPDTHVPYHDDRAVRLLLKVAHDLKPYAIEHLGDLGDFFTVSDHDRSPERAHSLKDELEAHNAFLDELDALKCERRLYIGNHDIRLSKHLAKKAPELWEMFNIEDQWKLKARGWSWTDYGAYEVVDGIATSHHFGFAGATALRRNSDRTTISSINGHTHRFGVIVEGTIDGKLKVSASFGWLGNKAALGFHYAADIQKTRDWALGFGVGWRQADGTLHIQPVPIINYSCVVAGKVYSV